MDFPRHVAVRLLLPALALALATAACTSGGTGTPTPTGTTVTVAVVDIAGNPVNGQAAAQVGDEAWSAAVPAEPGLYEVLVPTGEVRYGFIVNCPSGLQASSSKLMGYQATTAETDSLRVTCPLSLVGSTTTVEGNFDATALGADTVEIGTDVDRFFGPAATPAGAYDPLATTTGNDRTVLGIAYDASNDVIGLKVVRNLDIASPVNVNMTFAGGDAVGSFLTPDWSATVPVGYTASTSLSLVPENGQAFGIGSESTAMPVSLPTFPGMQGDDMYVMGSFASNGGSPDIQVATLQTRTALAGVDLDVPSPWTSTPDVVGSALPTFTGLTPLPSEPSFRGHMVAFSWDGIPPVSGWPNLSSSGLIHLFVTDGWLDGSTEYATPDITGIAGFEGAKPLSGEEIFWVVVSVASSLDFPAFLSSTPLPQAFSTGIYGTAYPPHVPGVVNRIALTQGTYNAP